MPLDLDQLRALAELRRTTTAVKQGMAAYDAAERKCWDMGISGRQIAMVGDLNSYATIYRRYTRRTPVSAR